MIRRAKKGNVRVLGVDSFRIRGGTIQPSMEHSVDYTYGGRLHSDADWDAALSFVESKATHGFVFEVVLGDVISIGMMPNQHLSTTDQAKSGGGEVVGER
jgi:hypothetical protein